MSPLPSPTERTQAGAAARSRVPLQEQGSWSPASGRADPIALLEEQAKTRIPDLVPVRYGRMLVSPLTFFRGAALPMAADLVSTPTSGLRVQLGGDAHLSNFGLFASPERDLLFDMNDFDETLPGPFEWDVKRLAASVCVAARTRDFGGHKTKVAVVATVRSYREHMHEYAGMRAMDVYYSRVDAKTVVDFADKRARPFLEKAVRSASHHDALHELPKLTAQDASGTRRIVDSPPTIRHVPETAAPVSTQALAEYRRTLQEDRRVLLDRYELVDAALKVVGVGSVGLGAFIVLLDGGTGEDPLFLQVKQAEASVLERFLGPSEQAQHGERVVVGQRRLQAASDVLLGWLTGPRGGQAYVRQLQDQKAGAVLDAMTYDDLVAWGALCGWALARGHARSGDPMEIAGYLGTDDAFDQAICTFAIAYAEQTERDHQALVDAVKAGRIVAETGV